MKVSVLMSVFNETESQIRESVESILQQTFQDFEVIIVNDNPNRNDVEGILNSYNDKRIIFSQNSQNIGLALSMNKAAELSHSDILARMDADDIAEPQRLESEIKYIQEGYDMVFSGYTFIDENSNPLTNQTAPEYSNVNIEKKIMLDPSIIHHPTTLFKRSIFKITGGYRNFPCSQDSDLWLRMAEAGARFYYVSDKLLRYRINSQSVSNKRWYKQQLTCNYIFDLSLERLKKGKDSFSTEGYNKYLEDWRINDVSAEENLRNCYKLLSESSFQSAKGNLVKAFFLRVRVFLSSSLLRKHYLSLQKKKRMITD